MNIKGILQHKAKLALSAGIIGLIMIYRNRSKPNPYLSTYSRVKNEIHLKVAEVQDEINQCQLQTREKAAIRNSSIPQLKEFMFKKKYSCLDIVITFIDAAIEKGFLNGYLCDVSFKEAIEQAKNCDKLIAQDPNVVNTKPLFGIPVSMKDTFISPKTYQSFCVASKTEKRNEEHGIQSFLITQAGGIIFAKTTLPQFGFSYESVSHLFGKAIHPTDQNRSAGGSSGGEGGLIGIGASPVGLGSDSGGSIRIPSHFCGLYGYKPSAKRLCMRGQAKGVGSWDGIRNIASCYGPMAKHFDNLVCMMEALTQNLDQAPVNIRDINFLMKDFDTTECYNDQKKMKIGVLRSMDMMLPCQSTVRALNETVERLRQLGHEVVEFEIPQNIYNQIFQIAYYVMLGDGGMKSTYELYKGEPLINHYDNFVKSSQSCLIYKKLYQIILKIQGRQRELMRWKAGDHGLSYYEMLNITASLAQFQIQMAQIWENMQIDALISPVTAGVAVKHNTAMNCFSAICYTFVWNMLDFSAGSVPVTRVQNNEQFYNELSLIGQKDIEYQVMVDQLKDSENLPVGIQVITRPFQDEICLNVMRQCAPQQQY